MKRNLLIILALFTVGLAAFEIPTPAQGPSGSVKTTSRMLYHNGPVRTGPQNVYFIFYGCWRNALCAPNGGADQATMDIPQIFTATIGNTPYMSINNTYTDASGQPASGSLVYGGNVVDNSYRHGNDLTKTDIEAMLYEHIGDLSQADLPADLQGIYVIVSTADIASNGTGFCSPGAPPFHSYFYLFGTPIPYIFLGNPNRCRTIAGGQYFTTNANGYVTPNGNFAGDAMTLNLAHAFNGLLADPYLNGWYDRYGLENADKCTGTFGQTYTTSNGARANFSSGGYDYLIEQNWVNDRKGRCALLP